jgi:hypothetical protein
MGFIFLAGFTGAAIGVLFSLWSRKDYDVEMWDIIDAANQEKYEAVSELQEQQAYADQLAGDNVVLIKIINDVVATLYRKDGNLRSRVSVDVLLEAMNFQVPQRDEYDSCS